MKRCELGGIAFLIVSFWYQYQASAIDEHDEGISMVPSLINSYVGAIECLVNVPSSGLLLNRCCFECCGSC